MTWARQPVAQAVAAKLAAVDPTVPAFATPPETFNPPAYVVGTVRTLEYDLASLGIDRAELRLFVTAGPNDYDGLDALCNAAKIKLNTDPTCGGAVQHLHVTHQENWRRQSIAGADVLTADLILEIRM